MEIELTEIKGQTVTFFNIDYVKPTRMITKKGEEISVISSGGKEFEVIGNLGVIKSMIRNSNMREASLIVNT